MKEEFIIVSENALEYFQANGITSKEWVDYCAEKYDLKSGDMVFYEGNKIGYRRNKLKE